MSMDRLDWIDVGVPNPNWTGGVLLSVCLSGCEEGANEKYCSEGARKELQSSKGWMVRAPHP